MPNNIKEYIDQDYEIVDMDNFDDVQPQENKRNVTMEEIKQAFSMYKDSDILYITITRNSGCKEYDPGFYTMTASEFKRIHLHDFQGEVDNTYIEIDETGALTQMAYIHPGEYSNGTGEYYRICLASDEMIKKNEILTSLRIKKLELLLAQLHAMDNNCQYIMDCFDSSGHAHYKFAIENKEDLIEQILLTIESAKNGSLCVGDFDYNSDPTSADMKIYKKEQIEWDIEKIKEVLKDADGSRNVYLPLYSDDENDPYIIQVTVSTLRKCVRNNLSIEIGANNGNTYPLSHINFADIRLGEIHDTFVKNQLDILNDLSDEQEIVVEYHSIRENFGVYRTTVGELRKKILEAEPYAKLNDYGRMIYFENGDSLNLDDYEYRYKIIVLTSEVKSAYEKNQKDLQIIERLEANGIATDLFLSPMGEDIKMSTYMRKMVRSPEEIVNIGKMIEKIMLKLKDEDSEIQNLRELIQKS